jgi:hypothetical protein
MSISQLIRLCFRIALACGIAYALVVAVLVLMARL